MRQGDGRGDLETARYFDGLVRGARPLEHSSGRGQLGVRDGLVVRRDDDGDLDRIDKRRKAEIVIGMSCH